MGCERKTDWRKKTGTRGAEISYKIVISNIFVLSYVLTYEDELTLMVGKSCLATLGSANSFGIQVSALTSKGRSVCSLGSTGGGCCTWLFHIKQNIVYNSIFPWLKHTAFYFPPGRLPWPSADYQTVQTVRLQTEHTSMLSLIHT